MEGVKRSLDVAATILTALLLLLAFAALSLRGLIDRAGLSPACAGADRTHRRPGVATGGRRQGLKRDEIRSGRDAGPSRAPDASGASASRGPFYFAWGCFRVFVS